MTTATQTIEQLANKEYQWGFVSDIDADAIPKGLSEAVVRRISALKKEPEFLLAWRLKAYRHWLTMAEPKWAHVRYGPINYQDIIYYSAPRPKKTPGSLDEVDPELRRTFQKLGISLEEQQRLSGVAVTRELRTPLVAYTGDTSPGGLDNFPAVFDAKILITEMSFIRAKHRREKIHKFGHMHLDDFLERADRFKNELIVCAHFSTRYNANEVFRLVESRLPEILRGRVKLWL